MPADPDRARWLWHYGCSSITTAPPRATLPSDAPRWQRERTHVCMCAAWRMNGRGALVWRDGRWCKPKPDEVKAYSARRIMMPEGAIEV